MIPEALLMNQAKNMIDSLIQKIVKPKMDNFIEKLKLDYNKLLIPRGEHFEEYLHRTYKKFSIISTLVFRNEQRLLRDLYIPLTIEKKEYISDNRGSECVKIDKYPVEIVKKYNNVLITDTAGMGKSTLTKYLFLDVIEQGYGIPIYIEMRRLSKNRTILRDIQEQINSLAKDFDLDLLLEFIRTGEFIFFLDGYDEISLEERTYVTEDVQNFISKANKNIFFLTSRPEQALSSFGDFQRFSICSLTKKEAYQLLRKCDKQGSVSTKLIDELKTGQYGMIDEFLTNPLLVSLLFTAFDYKQKIPLKKHVFYQQVYDAYFELHDLSKEGGYEHKKTSGLDIYEFERILRFIGFESLKTQTIEFDKKDLLAIIDKAKSFCHDLNFKSSDFLSDIEIAVPLFCIEGQYYRWAHKSLQEYFAAQFIYRDAKEQQDKILTKLYESDNIDKYVNTLDLYYDIDNCGFRKNILLPFCKEYIQHYEKNIFTSDIIEQQDIEYRIGCLFMHEVCMVKLKLIDEMSFPNEIEKYIKPYMTNKITRMFRSFNDNICYAENLKPKTNIFSIIYKRLPNLISRIKTVDAPLYKMPESKVYCIDVHTGDNNLEEYRYINYYLSRSFFNYKTCKKEVEDIEKQICSQMRFSLTEGF